MLNDIPAAALIGTVATIVAAFAAAMHRPEITDPNNPLLPASGLPPIRAILMSFVGLSTLLILFLSMYLLYGKVRLAVGLPLFPPALTKIYSAEELIAAPFLLSLYFWGHFNLLLVYELRYKDEETRKFWRSFAAKWFLRYTFGTPAALLLCFLVTRLL